MAVDYMWMTTDEKEPDQGIRGMPILVMKDEESGTIASHVIPEKGSHWFAVKTLGAEIRNLGYKKIIFKSDQEVQ